MTLFKFIIEDMKEPLSYLPQALPVGVAGGFLFYLFLRMVVKKPGRTGRYFFQTVLLFLFFTYLSVMLKDAFFSRPPGSRTSVDLKFLGTWGRSQQGNAYVIENIIMFMPWGILLPLLIKPFRKNGWICVMAAFISSITLEAVQYLTQRGHCQLDDVVMNTLGAFIGWVIVWSFTWIGRALRR